MQIYLDNAATTFPKPTSVYNAIMNYMTTLEQIQEEVPLVLLSKETR